MRSSLYEGKERQQAFLYGTNNGERGGGRAEKAIDDFAWRLRPS